MHRLGGRERFGQEHALRLRLSELADRLEDPALGLLAHALHGAHAARHAGRLEVVERSDAERGVQRRDLVEPQTRDPGQLDGGGRHALPLLLESLRAAGPVEVGDHRGQRRADARQGREPAPLDELTEIGIEALEDLGAARVGARLESLLTRGVEQPGHLAQGASDRQPIGSRCRVSLFFHQAHFGESRAS